MQVNQGDASPTMRADERRTVAVVSSIALIRMLGLFALLPVLSPHAGKLLGQTPLLVGLAVGAYGLTAALCQVPLGALSDRVGRVPVILLGLGVFAAGSVVAALSETIYGLVGGRLLQGAGAISATLTALLADATREAVRTRAMAVFGVGVGASFLLALIAGPLLSVHVGVAGIFWLTALLAGFAGASLVFLPRIPAPERRDSWSLLPALRPDLLRIDLYVFLLHAIMTATFVALPFWLGSRLELALLQHMTFYAAALLASLVITVPMVLNDHRSGRRRLVALAVGLLLIGQLGMAFLGFSAWTVGLAFALYLGGFSFLEAALPARLSVLAEDRVRGASLGVFSASQFLGAFVGGVAGGHLLAGGDPRRVFVAAALLAAIWLTVHALPNASRR